MSDMIDRVAQAIRSAMEASGVVSLVANGPRGEAALHQFFQVLAMDAIEAMREPTKDMRAAVENDRVIQNGLDDCNKHDIPDNARVAADD